MTSKKELEMQLREFRDVGYCWEVGEGEVGVACIAAPIFGPNKKILAATSITGTTLQITEENTNALGNLVKRYASVMSARLGGERG
jgi:IclR family acetate operon transcriptional repressor